MGSIIEEFRQIRASGQRYGYVLPAARRPSSAAGARSHRLASSALNRLRSGDASRPAITEWMLDDLADARADLTEAIQKIDAMTSLCREPRAVVPLLEAAE